MTVYDGAVSLPKVVLVADDDEDALAIVGDAISFMGYEVIEARDGDEAARVFKEAKPDLAVLDWMMPGLSGPEVCAEIKSSPGGELVPVLILTARDGIEDKVAALEGGADDYITKPFHLKELQARVNALLRVGELHQILQSKNEQLKKMQEKLIAQERQLVVTQLAGTAAHRLGQPLSAILLNCHLLDSLPAEDEKYMNALESIKLDANRMASLIDQLREVDAEATQKYYGEEAILDMESVLEVKK